MVSGMWDFWGWVRLGHWAYPLQPGRPARSIPVMHLGGSLAGEGPARGAGGGVSSGCRSGGYHRPSFASHHPCPCGTSLIPTHMLVGVSPQTIISCGRSPVACGVRRSGQTDTVGRSPAAQYSGCSSSLFAHNVMVTCTAQIRARAGQG